MARTAIIGETGERWILQRSNLDRSMLIDKGVAPIKEGQVLAFDEATGKLVKYDKIGADSTDFPFTIYTGEDKTTIDNDFNGTVLAFGAKVDKKKVIGIEESDFLGKHRLYLSGILLEEVSE